MGQITSPMDPIVLESRSEGKNGTKRTPHGDLIRVLVCGNFTDKIAVTLS